jgi:hypothetical protein
MTALLVAAVLLAIAAVASVGDVLLVMSATQVTHDTTDVTHDNARVAAAGVARGAMPTGGGRHRHRNRHLEYRRPELILYGRCRSKLYGADHDR